MKKICPFIGRTTRDVAMECLSDNCMAWGRVGLDRKKTKEQL